MDTNGHSNASTAVALPTRKALFVANYLAGANGTQAAIAAGYAEPSARSTAWRLLHRDKGVMQAIAESQDKIRNVAEVTAETMLAQFDEDRAFAIETKNATAACRASELKAKLAGLLIDRQDIRAVHGIKVEVVRFADVAA